MTSKEYLQQARNLNARINALLRERDELQNLACSISSPKLGDHIQTNRDKDASYTHTVEKICLLEEHIARETEHLVDLKTEIHGAISKVENPDEQLLLQYRYCEGCSWEDICIAMHMSVRTVHRVHAAALKDFTVPEECEKS